MKIRIPTFLHDLFGEETTLRSLILIMIAGLMSVLILPIVGQDALARVPIHLRLWVYVITFDVFAGTVANFTVGTKSYYQKHPKRKKWFVPIHIYPIVLVLLVSLPLIIGLYVYALILASSILVQIIKHPIHQWIIAPMLVFLNVIIAIFFFQEVPLYLHVIHTGIALKLILAFSITYPQKTE